MQLILAHHHRGLAKLSWTWPSERDDTYAGWDPTLPYPGALPNVYPPSLAALAAILLAELCGGLAEHVMLAGVVSSRVERLRHEREEARTLARAREAEAVAQSSERAR